MEEEFERLEKEHMQLDLCVAEMNMKINERENELDTKEGDFLRLRGEFEKKCAKIRKLEKDLGNKDGQFEQIQNQMLHENLLKLKLEDELFAKCENFEREKLELQESIQNAHQYKEKLQSENQKLIETLLIKESEGNEIRNSILSSNPRNPRKPRASQNLLSQSLASDITKKSIDNLREILVNNNTSSPLSDFRNSSMRYFRTNHSRAISLYSTKSCKDDLGQILGEMPAGYDDCGQPDGVNSRGLTPRITSYNPIDEKEELGKVETDQGSLGYNRFGVKERGGSVDSDSRNIKRKETGSSMEILVNFGTRDSLNYLGVAGGGERLDTGEFHGEDLSEGSGRESFNFSERSFADTGKKGDWNLALEGLGGREGSERRPGTQREKPKFTFNAGFNIHSGSQKREACNDPKNRYHVHQDSGEPQVQK